MIRSEQILLRWQPPTHWTEFDCLAGEDNDRMINSSFSPRPIQRQEFPLASWIANSTSIIQFQYEAGKRRA